MKRVATLSLMVLLMIQVLTGCSVSTANIKSAVMARDYKDGQAVDPTTVFKATDTFHCVAELANAPDDTKIKVVWTAVDAGGAKDQKILDKELVSGSGIANFTLTHDKPFPAGKYKAELFLNDKLDKTLTFEVQ